MTGRIECLLVLTLISSSKVKIFRATSCSCYRHIISFRPVLANLELVVIFLGLYYPLNKNNKLFISSSKFLRPDREQVYTQSYMNSVTISDDVQGPQINLPAGKSMVALVVQTSIPMNKT